MSKTEEIKKKNPINRVVNKYLLGENLTPDEIAILEESLTAKN